MGDTAANIEKRREEREQGEREKAKNNRGSQEGGNSTVTDEEAMAEKTKNWEE